MSQPFRDPLEQLHTRLDEANRDPAHPELQDLQRDTKGALEHADQHAAFSEQTGFRGRLEAAIERYGSSHPDLTRAAQNLLDVLSANGL